MAGSRRLQLVLIALFLLTAGTLVSRLSSSLDLIKIQPLPPSRGSRSPPVLGKHPPSRSTSSSGLSTPIPSQRDGEDKVGLRSAAVSDNGLTGIPPVPLPSPTNGTGTRYPLEGCAKKTSRDGPDHSHLGLVADEAGIYHAWKQPRPSAGHLHHHREGEGSQHTGSAVGDDDSAEERLLAKEELQRCHGAKANSSCIVPASVEWFRKHVLLGIASGKEGTFRIEVSQCTWLSHFPPENVFVFTDVAPRTPFTPHNWVQLGLPEGVYTRDCDVFSSTITKGYIREVRNAGMGYSAGWIVAQFRFAMGLEYMLKEAEERAQKGGEDNEIRWIFLGDDDTMVNLNNLVKRVKPMKHAEPWYLSRTGWGGAGHLYSLGAMKKLRAGLKDCVQRWFVKGFRASDTMLLKCARHLKMHVQKEGTMSHCPASTAGSRLMDKNQITFHGKKDFYPPVLRATWRTALYYHSMYCRNRKAMELATKSSACAYGSSCKKPHCTKQHDRDNEQRWATLSRNNTIDVLPFELIEGR